MKKIIIPTLKFAVALFQSITYVMIDCIFTPIRWLWHGEFVLPWTLEEVEFTPKWFYTSREDRSVYAPNVGFNDTPDTYKFKTHYHLLWWIDPVIVNHDRPNQII